MERRAIILGAGRGIRRLDFTKSYPSALEPIAEGRSALDWNVSVLRQAGIARIAFVGGYHIQKIIERHPEVTYFYDPDWQTGGEIAALLRARDFFVGDGLVLTCRAEALLTAPALAELERHPRGNVAATYRPQDLLGDGTAAKAPEPAFVLMREQLTELFEASSRLTVASPTADLDDLVKWMRRAGCVTVTDVTGRAASVRHRPSVARLLLSGKAQTLERLRAVVKSATVLDQRRFSANEWRSNRGALLATVHDAFGASRVVVRSSAAAEDHFLASSAGRFTSVLDVPADDAERLAQAIESVIKSFARAEAPAGREDFVFVQPYLADVAASGVLLTREVDTGAPYYSIDIDRSSGRTDVVTAGREGKVERIVVHRKVAGEVHLPNDVERLLATAAELEDLLFHDALDIEFATTQDGGLCVLQVRPLVGGSSRGRAVADEDVAEELTLARAFFRGLGAHRPRCCGRSTVLGVMSDWNPAEMIGTAPRRLAVSLYQRLIGDRAWAEARARIGYRDVTPTPLIVTLCGRPYVDVRASLSSFLPAGLPDDTAGRLVDRQLAKLRARPELHDKIEFEIAWTCSALDAAEREGELHDFGLGREEVADLAGRLRDLTDGAIASRAPAIDAELAKTDELERRRKLWLAHATGEPAAVGQAVWALAAECERLGTEPFSVLARYAFVAMSFLRSLQHHGVLSPQELEAVGTSLTTVGGEVAAALASVHVGELARADFLATYGHLRPSTYDIMSASYRENPDLYLSGAATSSKGTAKPGRDTARRILAAKQPAIDALLARDGHQITAEQLIRFILDAIPARERSKFEFTRTIDSILQLLARWAESLGFDRDAASHLSIHALLRVGTDSLSAAVKTELLRDIEFARKRWALSRAIQLPPLIDDEERIEAFTISQELPNFVGGRRVVAPICHLDSGATELEGKVVAITSADPGFDWIFSHPIAGLVTRYGGVASHMAIRAAEFGLPAAIGCGALLFERVCAGHTVDLDCAGHSIRVVR